MTTTDIAAQVLARLGPTVAPIGSRNNELGVPETVTCATADTRFLVLEMGARHIGDIKYLTDLVRPHVGVVLNVGTAHVAEFGGQAAIAAAKGELVEALLSDGLAVLNADDPLVSAMSSRTRAQVVSFGCSPVAQVRAGQVSTDGAGRASFTLHAAGHTGQVSLRLHGEHLVANALATAAVALRYTDDLAMVAEALSEAVPGSDGRMRVTLRSDGVTIVNDAYNANPHSMSAALRTLAAMSGNGRRSVVRGRRTGAGFCYAVTRVSAPNAVRIFSLRPVTLPVPNHEGRPSRPLLSQAGPLRRPQPASTLKLADSGAGVTGPIGHVMLVG